MKLNALNLTLYIASISALSAVQPNIVFIMADDLGYGDVGCYGASDIRTPNLDRLAKEGMRFTDFYANGAVCSPTRIAFLTGRYQQRYGMDNALYYQEMGRGLPVDRETLPSILRSAGYATGLSGKWHLGYDFERQPLQQGFDHFFGLLGGNHHYFQHMDRIGVHDLWLGNETIKREGYTTNLISEDALQFIEKHRDSPFFLFLSHAAPHFPWQGPNDQDKEVRPKKKSWQTGDRATYVAMVESMDAGIGTVLDQLDELKLSERTLVVFTSDNGGHTYSSNAPLRGEKATLWEGGIRVPCIVRWPGTVAGNSTSSEVGITMDWTATFLAMAGVSPDQLECEGIDLRPILNGDALSKKRELFWRRQPGPYRKKVAIERAVRSGDWKYLEQPENEVRALFHLPSDIGEETNLISEHPEKATELRHKFEAWNREIDSQRLNEN